MIKNKMVWLWMFMAAVIGLGASMPAHALENDAAAVRAAEDEFYAALNTLFTGNLEPMREIWSHAVDVTSMGPGGGFQDGWQAVLEVWEETAAMKLGGKVTPERLNMMVSGDIAVIQTNEIGENLDKAGQPLNVRIRATNLFRKEGGKWKMIGHHTDLLPFL